MKSSSIPIFITCLISLNILRAQETEYVYLSGKGFDDAVEWNFYCSAGRKSGSWQKIEVPSCWEQQGFGSYNYGHDPYEERVNETGRYRYSFNAEENWKGKNVKIVFDGVMTDCEVFINGKSAGPVHQGAFYQFRYDITNLLKYGSENLLEIIVYKHSENESVNQAERKADYWIFGGVYRPVYLEIRPEEHIERVAIDAKANGDLNAEVYTSVLMNAALIRTVIRDESGNHLTSFETKIDKSKPYQMVTGQVESPALWSPEFPNLYTIHCELLDRDQNIIHRVSERIGFRTVEVREEDGIYVNGVKIKFKGVNRHTFHPDHGRTSSKSLSIEVVNLIKDMNMNAVRMSHYPPDEHFLDVCDSLGLFVLDELAGWQKPPYDDEIGRKLLEEMITRDVNHPSIVLWNNGNEGGWNTSYDDYFQELDIQKREVIHPWEYFGKTNTRHYIDYNYLSADNFNSRAIFFPTEFLHGLYDGGHGAGLEDYWSQMWGNPLCAGGFLWVFADETLKRSDNGELDSDGNHAPDGILGPYHEKEGSFFTIREIWSPVFFRQKNITEKFDGSFNIENRFHFTGLNQCTFNYQWVKLPGPEENEKRVLSEGSPLVANLKPGAVGRLHVPLDVSWRTADVLYIEAYDPYGRLINQWSWAVKTPSHVASGLMDVESGNQEITVEENESQVILSVSGVSVELSKADGTMLSVNSNSRIIPLSGGPALVSKAPECREVKHYKKENNYVVEAIYDNQDMHVFWTIRTNGLIDLDVKYQPANETSYAGITFNYPENNITKVKWMGNGPYRVWKNRMKGVTLDVWEKDYNNTITGHSGFIYPEFKGYFSSLYWAEITDGSTGFKVYSRSDDIFLRLLTAEEAPDPVNTTVEHPPGDMSFLHGIPPIGTKFKTAEYLGPQSSEYYFNPAAFDTRSLKISLTFDFR